jgi:hypothetical protein
MTFVLMFFGCTGKSQKKSDVQITLYNLSNITGPLAGFGKFRIYAHSPDTNQFFGVDASGGTFDTQLESGLWNFSVVGWDGASEYTGNTICGKNSFNIPGDLNAGKAAINLTAAMCRWFF